MNEDFPTIDDLVSGINDPDVSYLDGLRKAAQDDGVVEEKHTVKGKSEDKAETKAHEKAENRMEKKQKICPYKKK